MEASRPADKQFKSPVPSLSQSLAGDAPSLNREKGEPGAAASAFGSPWCPRVCCRRREESRSAVEGCGTLQKGAACGAGGAAGCAGSRENTAAFQPWEMMARGEQHLQTNPARFCRAGFGLSPPACFELRHEGMVQPSRADLVLLERATRGLRKEFAPPGAWGWRQKDPGAAELPI